MGKRRNLKVLRVLAKILNKHVRYCDSCGEFFLCSQSCESRARTLYLDWCFCVKCYSRIFGQDASREKCDALNEYRKRAK